MIVRRILLLCGVLSPLLYAVADTLAGLRWEGYNFRDQTISELGAIGAPSRPLFAALLIPAYLLLVAFGAGLWQSAEGRRGVRVAAGLVIGFGALALTVGQFAAMRVRGAEQGRAGMWHLVEGGVAMVTLAVMPAFGVWSVLEAPRINAGLATPWVGVRAHVFWYTCQLWFLVLAVTLFQ
jgi:hypothetical protein